MSDLTDEEIAQMPSITKEDLEAIKLSQDAIVIQLQEKEQARQSAINKLMSLGLTLEEATALFSI